MTIRVNAFGKTIAFPAGTSPEEIEKHISSNRSLLDPEYKAPETGMLASAAQFGKEFAQNSLGVDMGIDTSNQPTGQDYLKGFASGANKLVSGIGYLAEVAGAKDTGKSIREFGDRGAAYWNNLMSSGGKQAAADQVFEDDEDSITGLRLSDNWGKALLMGASQSAPSMFAAAVPGALTTSAIQKLASLGLAGGSGATIPLLAGTAAPVGVASNVIARTPAAIGFGSAEGITAGAMNAADLKSSIEGMPLEEKRKSPVYLVLEAEHGEEKATKLLAEQAAFDVFGRTAVSTGAIGALTGGGALGQAYQKATGAAKGGILNQTIKGSAQEALQEAPQSGMEKLIENVATRDYLNPDQNIMDGVLADAASGAAIGGLMGGVVGGAGAVNVSASRAAKINEERTKLGLNKIASSGSVDEAINAAAETVAQKPVTSKDIWDDQAARDDLLMRASQINQQKGVQNEAQVQGTETPAAKTDVLDAKSEEKLLNQAVANDGSNYMPSAAQLDKDSSESDIIAQNLGNAAKGAATEIILPDNTTLPAEWMVVDADNVKATMKNGVNQPRDRTRAAADVQIQQIANQPDYRRMSDSPVMDIGAPTLSSDDAIVGGNGRFEGVSRGYDAGTSAAYRAALEADAVKKGIDPATFSGMKKPVLVRRVTQPFDTQKLAVASNSGGSLEYSALERAKIDAERMGDIDQIDVTDSGDIALTKDNAANIRNALKGYGASELGSFVDNEGNLSQEGSRRLKNAILYSAYGNSKTLSRMVESTDTDMRNIVGALTKTAGQAARVRKNISQGGLPKSLDITDNLIEAVEKIGQIRSSGDTVDNYLTQGELFSDIALSEETKEIMTGLSDVMRSRKRMTEFLRATYDLIEKVDVTTENIFGEPDIPKKLEVVKHAKKQTAEQRPASLFGEESGKESAAKVNNVTSAEAGAKYSRSPEERLKDREKSRKLERALKREGYDFRIQTRDVRLGITPDGKGQEAIAAEQIARVFRKRISWIEAEGDFKINGVMVPSIPDTIFIDVNTNKAAHIVMGHELSHHMEQDVPEVYQAMVDALMPMIRDVDAYHALRKLDDMKQENVIKEIVGDIVGDNFADPEFWNKVAAYNPNAFRKIADTIISWIKRLVINAKARGLGSERWVTDAQKAQDIVAKAVSQYTYAESSFDGLKNKPVFQKAWHGSPHDHDKFDASKIGTGEGAQAYGYGLYFTDTREVAEWYKDNLSYEEYDRAIFFINGVESDLSVIKDEVIRDEVKRLIDNASESAETHAIDLKGSLDDIIRDAKEDIDLYYDDGDIEFSQLQDRISEAENLKETGLIDPVYKAGRIYQVELTPEPDEYLLWDKPLSEQSKKVIETLQENMPQYFKGLMPSGLKGRDLYVRMAHTDIIPNAEGEASASKYLHSIGIRGIKYLDGSSRGTGEGSYNYVIFDDKDVEITAKFSRTEPVSRKFGYPSTAIEPLFEFKNSDRLKLHKEYKEAKSGDIESAIKLVKDLVSESNLEEARTRFGSDVVYLPVVLKENDGTNRIPHALAALYANHSNAEVETGVFEQQKAFHTGMNMMERLISRASFSGDIVPGKRYVLVDDVTTSGATLSDLASYIQENGGEVAGSVLLTNAMRGGSILPQQKTIKRLEDQHGDSIRELFGIEPSALTREESQYLLGFRTDDEIRNRAFKARDSRRERILAKSISKPEDSLKFSRSTSPPETITIDGKERPTRNSNGKLIHPTEEGIRNFWKWFGDSKIVDDQGKPLAVYHGSDADFNVFRTASQMGAHFGNQDQAEYMGKNKREFYSKLLNPLRLKDAGGFDPYDVAQQLPGMIDQAKVIDLMDSDRDVEASDYVQDVLQKNGFDGIVYLNRREGLKKQDFKNVAKISQDETNAMSDKDFKKSAPSAEDSYIVFNPNQIKSAAGNTGQFSPDNDDIRFSRSETLSQAGVNTEESAKPSGLPEETKLQAFRRRSQDAMLRFKVMQNWLKEYGVNLSEAANVYQRENISKGKTANRIEDFRRDKLEPLIKRIAETSKKATGEGKFDLADIATYLEAVHIPEANERMRTIHKDDKATANGITDKQARDVIKQFESMPNFSEFRKLADDVRKIGVETLDMRLEAGLISQDQYDAYKSTYKNWVPLRGNMSKQGFGKGMSTNAKDKRRIGHGFREEEFVIENLVQDRERAIMQIEKNKIGMTVAQFLMEAENPNIGTIDKPEKMRVMKDFSYAVTFKGRTVGSFETEAGARNAINKIMERKGDLLPDGESFTQTDFNIDKSYDPHIVMMARPQLAENEIQVYVNGHAVKLQLNDPGLARAATAAGIEQVGAIAHGARMFNRFLSKAYTAWSPDFLFMNMARDAYSGTLVLTGKKGAAFAAKTFTNYGTAIRELIKGRNDPKQSEWVTRYRAAGGNIGAAYLSDLERVGEDAVAALQEFAGARETYRMVYNEQISKGYSPAKARTMAALKAGVAKTKAAPVVGHMFKTLERVNMVIENALRLATFKTAIESGESDQQAAMLSKDLMNFNRKGEMANQMGALYLFYNPGMQGAHIVGEALFTSKHRKQVWSLLGALTTLSFILAEFARGGEDDDDREWENTPDYIKDRNLIFQFGDKQITVPVAYGFGIFHAMGNYLSDLNHGADKSEIAVKLASGMFENFSVFGNPIVGDDGDTEIRMDQVLPTLPKLIMAPGINMDSLGRQIHPTKYQDSVPDSQLMWRSVRGTAYEDIAHFMNDITGGSQYNPGAIDISPNTIKYWVTALTGGAGRFVSDITTGGLNAAEGISPEIENVPVLRKFIREPGVNDSRGAFHKARKEAQTAAERAGKALRNGDMPEYTKMMTELQPIIDIAKYARDAQKMAAMARDEIMRIQLDKDMSKAEKKLRIKEIELQEQRVYDQFLSAFDVAKRTSGS